MTNFWVRFVSASCAIPVFIFCYLSTGIWYHLLVAGMGCLGVHECVNLLFHDLDWKKGVALKVGLVACLLTLLWQKPFQMPWFVWTLIAVMFVGSCIISNHSLIHGWRAWLKVALGYVYLLPSFAFLYWLRDAAPVMLPICIPAVWLTDIGSYAAGKLWGGPKLFPAISPNKTWAGVAGGIVLPVVIFGAFGLFLKHTINLWSPQQLWQDVGWFFYVKRLLHLTIWDTIHLFRVKVQHVVVFGLVPVVCQIGDLFESALKRTAGVKDSGVFLPGHGGVLDRLDGLMTVCTMLGLACILGLEAPLLRS